MDKAVADLRSHPSCQARECMDEQALEEYADAYRAGGTLPPLDVFQVEDELVIVDGFHRHEAARRAGVLTLAVRVVGQGSMADAEWHALGSNQKHGLRRTREDKRHAVRMALELDDSRGNREIARHLGVSDPFVGKIRSQEQGSSLPSVWLDPNLVSPASVEAAELVDVTPRMVERAGRLTALAPWLSKSVWNGEMTLDRAEWCVGIALRDGSPRLDGRDDDRQRLSLAILAECRPELAKTDERVLRLEDLAERAERAARWQREALDEVADASSGGVDIVLPPDSAPELRKKLQAAIDKERTALALILQVDVKRAERISLEHDTPLLLRVVRAFEAWDRDRVQSEKLAQRVSAEARAVRPLIEKRIAELRAAGQS